MKRILKYFCCIDAKILLDSEVSTIDHIPQNLARAKPKHKQRLQTVFSTQPRKRGHTSKSRTSSRVLSACEEDGEEDAAAAAAVAASDDFWKETDSLSWRVGAESGGQDKK